MDLEDLGVWLYLGILNCLGFLDCLVGLGA